MLVVPNREYTLPEAGERLRERPARAGDAASGDDQVVVRSPPGRLEFEVRVRQDADLHDRIGSAVLKGRVWN